MFNVIFSGGGIGGYIFFVIVIVDQVKVLVLEVNICFVGVEGCMEMEWVLKVGYFIEGLWISGIQCKLIFENLFFFLKLVSSLCKVDQILCCEQLQVVVGIGGYVSGFLLCWVVVCGIFMLIQEQNVYVGLINKWLVSVVDCICVVYFGMEKYFFVYKLMEVGNFVWEDLLVIQGDCVVVCVYYGFDLVCLVIMVMGGLLGVCILNQVLVVFVELIVVQFEVQILWQCGKFYIE